MYVNKTPEYKGKKSKRLAAALSGIKSLKGAAMKTKSAKPKPKSKPLTAKVTTVKDSKWMQKQQKEATRAKKEAKKQQQQVTAAQKPKPAPTKGKPDGSVKATPRKTSFDRIVERRNQQRSQLRAGVGEYITNAEAKRRERNANAQTSKSKSKSNSGMNAGGKGGMFDRSVKRKLGETTTYKGNSFYWDGSKWVKGKLGSVKRFKR